MTVRKTVCLFFLFVMIAVLAGCEKRSVSGSLIISVTDDPFPVEMIQSATVLISGIKARKAEENDASPYISIFDDTASINLMDLQNGLTGQLIETEISIGSYDQVRLYVEKAGLTLIDGRSFEVKVPGGSQSGIKVFISPPVAVEEGVSSELLLDFDLSRSFILKGNADTPAGIKGFNFKPVIRAVNISEAGRIAGKIKKSTGDYIENVEVTARMDTVVSTSFSDNTGYYALIGLPTGIYDLTASREGFSDYTDEVVVIAGNKTQRNITLSELKR